MQKYRALLASLRIYWRHPVLRLSVVCVVILIASLLPVQLTTAAPRASASQQATRTPSPPRTPSPTSTPMPSESAPAIASLPAHYYIAPDGSDKNDGSEASNPLQTIQHALELVQPGDTIQLAPGDYLEALTTMIDGLPDAPITVLGPPTAILRGDGESGIAFEVNHNHYTLVGFTIDGLHGDPDETEGYTDKLLYAQGQTAQQGINGLKVLHMTLQNAGGECMRLRYFAQHNEVAYSTFRNCGRFDFALDGDGKNGEAIYIGTSSKQWADGRNPTAEPDQSTQNWVHHNVIDTQGNECVDMKEGSHHNIVEYNTCTGQLDDESGGFGSRGNENIIRYNVAYGNVGAGVRLGGHKVDGIQYGRNNEVYGNRFYANKAGGLNIVEGPQKRICGNVLDAKTKKPIFGDYGANSDYDPVAPCEG
ncbi:MAG: DUF1565 domain-containing protein [Chloroflexota bacterium]|nr:DUF1565 domain-containing protein [Chloroflexota bacterium]